MSESLNSENLCPTCPLREKTPQILGKIISKPVTSCPDRIIVSRSKLVSTTLPSGEPAPPHSSYISEGGLKTYLARSPWEVAEACGRELIGPGPGEIPFDINSDDGFYTGVAGERYAAFVYGSEEALETFRRIKTTQHNP